MNSKAVFGRMILERMSTDVREAVVEAILNVPNDEHIDRVARINASLVIANKEPLYLESGFRNPKLLEGSNIVRSYLYRMALDHGVKLEDPE